MSTPKLLLPTDYVKAATEHINQAREHVSLVCMMMTNDSSTDKLVTALSEAAKRGVKVQVAADVFTYGEFGGHFVPLKYYTKQSRITTKMAKELTKNGVKFTWLGQFSTLPWSGRAHTKCLVVDDYLYSFGGVNLDDRSLSYVDYMFEIRDHQLAAELRDEISRLINANGKNFAYRSHEFSFKDDKVLIDGGLQGDSIIYRRACHYAQQATDILFVSQYCPSGKLGRIMKKKNSRLYFNKPSNANFSNGAMIGLGMLFSGNRTLYSHETYLHAKFMIFTLANGKKVAITGSHNFSTGGVMMGTREIALETTDKKVISQLEAFFEKRIQ